MTAPAPEPSPDVDQRCVWCGAFSVPSGVGEVQWVVGDATPPDCDHETLTGQT